MSHVRPIIPPLSTSSNSAPFGSDSADPAVAAAADSDHVPYSGRTPMVTIHEASRVPLSSIDGNICHDSHPHSSRRKDSLKEYDTHRLSPRSEVNPTPTSSLSPLGNISTSPSNNPVTPTDNNAQQRRFETPQNPFNFETVQYSAGRAGSASKSNFGRRQGHKYKHSSVSHALLDVQQPTNRVPLQIPASLPIPTFSEFRSSMNRDQKLRALWCVGHFAVAGSVLWLAHTVSRENHKSELTTHRPLSSIVSPPSLPMTLTALSHLLFFDALGAVLCVAVDVGSNFEVWSRSSVSFPFGLRRLELLSSLSMGVGLLFMGFDLISHTLSHSLSGGHGSSSVEVPLSPTDHGDTESEPFTSLASSLHFASLASILATLISASILGNHARMGKAMRLSGGVSPHSDSFLGRAISRLPGLLSNPSHLLTLSCSTVILMISSFPFSEHTPPPLPALEAVYNEYLHPSHGVLLDNVLAIGIASCMVLLGGRICLTLGKMLLMSFPAASQSPTPAKDHNNNPVFTTRSQNLSLARLATSSSSSSSNVSDVIRTIRADPAVSELEDARFWQVHYELAMANIRLSIPKHRVAEVTSVRERTAALIRNRLSAGCGDSGTGLGAGFRWEVSIQIKLID